MENERELEISLTYRPKPPKYKQFTAEERPEAVTKTVEWEFRGRRRKASHTSHRESKG
jgi:hypothetical protein